MYYQKKYFKLKPSMKKIVISSLLVGITFGSASVFAQEIATPTVYSAEPVQTVAVSANLASLADPGMPTIPTLVTPVGVTPVVERTESVMMMSLEKTKARGAALVKERVYALEENAKAVAKSNGLTAEQKTAFAAYFTQKQGEMTSLGAKIAQGTDASSTKSLVVSIMTDYRIFAIVLPQVRLEKRIYEVHNHAIKLNETFAKVQLVIDSQKGKGKDVTSWQKNLDEAKLTVASDTEKLAVLFTKIDALKPLDYGTTSQAVILDVNSGIKNIAKDFQAINAKIRKPSTLKALNDRTKNTQNTGAAH
jgi:hypothetical protein